MLCYRMTAAAAAAALTLGLVVAPARAASTPAGATSVPVVANQGKSQGSGLWGYVGDIDTRTTTTFTYGVAFDPTDESMVVTDSGKVVYSTFSCGLVGQASPCQIGTPRVFDYRLNAPTAGTGEGAFTSYTVDGVFTGTATPSASTTGDGTNAGLGLRYASLGDRTVVTLPTANGQNLKHGPRGVAFAPDGTAFVVDSESVAPVGGTPGAVLRFGQGLTDLPDAGWTGVWAQRDQPGVHFYRVGAATTPQGTVLVNSETSDRLQEYAADGTWIRSIKLDLPANTAGQGDPGYRNPYGIAVDPVDGSLYLPLVNFRDDAYWQTKDPFIEKRDANGALIGTFGQGRFARGQVIFGVAVEPKTRDVFAWTQTGSIQQFTSAGTFVREFTAAEFPGLTNVRAVAFDPNGRMYVTVAEGTNNTRVMILGKTPAPVTELTASCPVDKDSVTLTWANASATAKAPYQQSSLLDFVVERSPKGQGQWQVVPKPAASTATSRTLQGLGDASAYDYRVSAWNEAGNGDTAVVAAPTCAAAAPALTVGKAVSDASGDGVARLAETLTYTYTVTNTGNVLLTSTDITDQFTRGGTGPATAITCQQAQVAPQSSISCTQTYTVVQADLDAGSIDNTAVGHAMYGSVPVDSAPASATIRTDSRGALTLTKKADTPVDVNGNGVTDPGDTVSYTFIVTNTGTVTLTGVAIVDPLLSGAGVNITCAQMTLAPGATTTCRSTAYTIRAAGTLTNTATATGNSQVLSATVTSTDSTAVVSVVVTPPSPTPTLTPSAPASPSATGSPPILLIPSPPAPPRPSLPETGSAVGPGSLVASLLAVGLGAALVRWGRRRG